MTSPAGRYAYQRLVWPHGGGEVIDDRVLPLPTEIDPSTFLDYFQSIFGEPTESAMTDVGEQRVAVGWVFAAQPDLEDVIGDVQGLEV